MDEVKRIRGLGDTAGAQGYASLLGQFNAATDAARGGDQDAAKGLPALSKSLLDAAEAAATSRQDLDRIQNMAASSLEETYALIMGTASASQAATAALAADGGTADSQSWWSTFSAGQASAGDRAANDDVAGEVRALRAEVAGLRADNNSGNAALISAGNRTAKTLENVSSQSGGDAFATVAAA